MKRIEFSKLLLILSLLFVGFTSCSDDDNNGVKVTPEVYETAQLINDNLEAIQDLVNAHLGEHQVNDVVQEGDSYTLSFSSGNKTSFKKGNTKADIPVLSAQLEEETYYWAIRYGNEWVWLTDGGKKVEVQSTPLSRLAYTRSGKTIAHPVFGVNLEGFWTVDFGKGPELLKDNDGLPVEAKADLNLSFIPVVNLQADEVGVELANEVKFQFIRQDVALSMEQPEDKLPILLEYGKEQEIEFTAKGVENLQVVDLPKGWKTAIDEKSGKLQVTAPQAEDEKAVTEATIKLQGEDKNGVKLTAEAFLYTVDFTHPGGTLIVTEGNMGDQNGTVLFLDQFMRAHEQVFEKVNGVKHGNVLQDLYISEGKIYLISQNGKRLGGSDRFVICNGRTFKKEYEHSLEFQSAGVAVWPQHLVVANDKAYIQYATNMETHSGIRVFDLKSKTIAAKDIEGTFGEFTKEGALKGRMHLSKGKIFAGLGNGLVLIDPATAQVVKSISFKNRQVKGLVKGADGNFYVALSREYDGTAPYAPVVDMKTKAVIVGINHEGKEISRQELPAEVDFPVMPWSPSISMAASFTKDQIYLTTSSDFSVTAASRYNYKTNSLEKDLIQVSDNLYGYMGVHPFSEILFVGLSVAYTSTEIHTFQVDKESDKLTPLKEYSYREASPAGVDFGYRYTEEYINK